MKTIFASALLCCSLAVHSEGEITTETMPAGNLESDIGKLNIVLAAGLTLGGDDLASTTNGRTMQAGGLIYLAAGGVYHVSTNMDMQVTIGLHFDVLQASDGTAEFNRSFFELLPFYVADSGNRFGIGFTQIMSPEYTDPYYKVPFKDTNGLIVEYDWMLSRHFYMGFRYADITYQDKYDLLVPINGSYIGVIMQANF